MILSSKIIIASKSRYRRCITVDETKLCINKPLVIVDKSPWYRWALERLGLEYRHERLGLRNRVERFFGYLKQRTERFYNNINTWKIQSIEDYASTIAITRNLYTTIKTQGRVLPSLTGSLLIPRDLYMVCSWNILRYLSDPLIQTCTILGIWVLCF